MNLSNAFDKLKEKAAKLGYTVQIKGFNQCAVHNKLITIDPRQRLENKLYALAHEIGHARTLRGLRRKFGCLTKHGNDKTWSTLESEFIAWHHADIMMKELDLYQREYIRFKHAALGCYYRYK
jgi:hypothetical protein